MLLDTIKEVLTGYSPTYNLTIECLNIIQTGKSIEITEKVTDHNDGDSIKVFNCTVPLPNLILDNKTYINIAQDVRKVKVVSKGNHFIIGTRTRNEYSMEIQLRERQLDIFKRSTNELIYPRKILSGKKLVPAYDPFILFSYFNVHSEYFNDNFPELTDELRDDISSLVDEFVFDEGVLKSISIYSKTRLTDTTLTDSTVQAILDMIDNRDQINEVPLPSDYKVGTTDNLIARDLRENQYSIRSRIMKTYFKVKNGTANNISMSELKSALFKITRDNDNGVNPYQQDTDTNALSLLSQKDKTYFKTFNIDSRKFVSQRLDPKYFVGIIDPSFTADSNLINIKNSLARSAVISNEGFKIKLMTKNFEPVILDSGDALLYSVLSSDNVDYVNKKLVPNEFGEYSVYQFGEYKYVKSVDEIDYIRYEDSVISESTALIPFANKTVPMRLMLSTHMIADQAVPVVGAKPSIVYTDVNEEIYDNSKQVIRSEISGKVKGVGRDYINIDGNAIPLPESKGTSNHTTVTFNKNVSKGDIVEVGTVIAKSNSFVDNEFTVNVPLLTAYTTWFGWDHEDAVVISESAAKKLGHLDTYQILIQVKYNKIDIPEINDPNLDAMNLIKTGAKVKPGDTLFAYNQIISNLGVEFPRLVTVKVPSHITGTVRNVRFKLYESKRTQGVDQNKYLRPEYSGLPKLREHFMRRLAEDWSREAKATGLNPIDIAKSYQFYKEEPSIADNIFADIIITIDYVNNLKTSDKMTNQYGGKGTISKIVPDDQFLRTEDGTVIDIIVSPLAILARSNPSQMYESLLSLICVEFYKILDKWFSDDPKVHSEFTEEVLQSVLDDLYWYNETNDMEAIYNDSKKYGYLRVRVSSFDKHFTSDLLKSMRDRLHIKDEVKLYNPITKSYIRTPIRIGYQNFYRLHFFPENKMTSRGGNKGLLLKDRSPVIGGYGRVKAEGQKIGEQELWALQAHGLTELSKSYVNKAGKQDKLLSDFLSLELALQKVDEGEQ